MKVFVTGATGFVGTAIVRELRANGHEVIGLARSDHSASALQKLGAAALRGDLESPETLREGVQISDAIIHAGFIHDFSRFAEACAIDHVAIETLGATIGDSGKAFIVTAGVAALEAPGPIALESDKAFPPSDAYPRASEVAARALSDRGVPVNLMRLPPSVHGRGDHGFVPMLIDIARLKGVSAYVGDGASAWPAVHVDDAARAFRLSVERGASSEVYHAVAEQGVAFRQIAEAIAKGLDIHCVSMSVDEAREHFSWFYEFASIDQPASSKRTQEILGWTPRASDLLNDIMNAGYFADRHS